MLPSEIDLMTEILQLDQSLFFFINDGLQNSFFDAVLPWLRNKYFWIPLYVFLFFFLFLNFKKKGLILILGLIFSVGIADITSSHFIKKSVKRVRPCNDFEINEEVRTLVRCGGGYSFTSSHAANHFAIATFLILTLGQVFRRIKLPLFFWALFISFAQIYVGVHYPLDILCGAILGVLCGYLGKYFYEKIN